MKTNERPSRPQPTTRLLGPITCRIDGVEVALEELRAELVRCGGPARKGRE
jgi:hypothetical protein